MLNWTDFCQHFVGATVSVVSSQLKRVQHLYDFSQTPKAAYFRLKLEEDVKSQDFAVTCYQ